MNKELGKIIRDSIHGDIFIDNKFMGIINTREFQRLRRINQLSVGNLVFPSAQHTRFSHSIGTFYLMEKIIIHIESQLKNINIEIRQKDKNLAMLIALLHDVGHGPFSHAFEGISDKNHEEWTKEIILGSTEINKEIVKNFGEEFPHELIELINKGNINPNNNTTKNEVDLFFVIKSLISSQLDADRLDYLVRDARSAGVVFGDIDLSRIIESIRITEFKNEIYVCVPEKNSLDIKNYLLARDNMHESVYFHPIKCELEEIIKLIFKRCRYLIEMDAKFEEIIPIYLKQLIRDKDISLENYIYVDDYVIITFFKGLLNTDDFILRTLCNAIIDRKPFRQIEVLNNSKEEIENFKTELNKIIINNSKCGEYDIKVDYYWIEVKVKHVPYKRDDDKVYVLTRDGTIDRLENVVCGIENSTSKIYTALNIDIILELIEEKEKEKVKMYINKLIDIYSNRNHIEIERKYLIKNITLDEIIGLITDYGMDVEDGKCINQIDIYYDTNERYFLKNNIACRVREKEKELYATIKTPTSEMNNNERFEYEFKIENYEVNTIAAVMKAYINNDIFDQILNSEKILEVNNTRRIVYAIKNDVKYEIAYDDIRYNDVRGNEVMHDNELEIELKSNYYHRVHLKQLSEYLLMKTSGLSENNESKYRRGMKNI